MTKQQFEYESYGTLLARIATALEAQTTLLEENVAISRLIHEQNDEFTVLRKQELAMQEQFYKKQEWQSRFLAETNAMYTHQHLDAIHQALRLPLKGEEEATE